MSGNAPELELKEVVLFERDVRLRLPFRFGVVTLRATPQAFVRVRISLAGREARGMAAELMVPKWFDKRPGLSNDDNVDQLRIALGIAREAYLTHRRGTAFSFFASTYAAHLAAAAAAGLPPLAAGFGPALIDRAIFDALCRALGVSFAEAVSRNLPGIAAGELAPDLGGFDLPAMLASLVPAATIAARHTVGLADPLAAADISERLDDGLPETLEEVIAAYGHRYFKVKVSGNVDADIARLSRIARVIEAAVPDYAVTLDGNEQFEDAAGVLDLLDALEARPELERLRAAILFLEQPVHRDRALAADITALARRVPVIIDESDATLDAFLAARKRGYSGVSSKSCKGFYKSILNLARVRRWRAEGGSAFLSGEDLTCQAGLAVQQDLALAGLLGLIHVERNGHHYVRGMAGAPAAEEGRFRSAHPDLYEDRAGALSLAIRDGLVSLASLDCVGFASAAEPDWSAMREMPQPAPVAASGR